MYWFIYYARLFSVLRTILQPEILFRLKKKKNDERAILLLFWIWSIGALRRLYFYYPCCFINASKKRRDFRIWLGWSVKNNRRDLNFLANTYMLRLFLDVVKFTKDLGNFLANYSQLGKIINKHKIYA